MNDRFIETALEERLGDLRAPDLTDSVLGAGESRRREAMQRVELATSSRAWTRQRIGSLPWLAAALVVAAFGVVLGVEWLAREPSAESSGTQDPDVLLPQSREEFLEVLGDVRSISFRALSQPDPAKVFRDGEPQVVLTGGREVTAIVDALRSQLRPTAPAGWDWMHTIRLHLRSGRAVELALNLHEGDRLGIRGLGDFVIDARAAQLLRTHVDAADWIVRRELGIVNEAAELERFPDDLRTLRARTLGDADLVQLERFSELRALDLSGSTVSDAGIDSIVECTQLESFRMRNATFGDAGLAKLARLPRLHELDLSHSTDVTGSGFAAFAGHGALVHLDLSWSRSLDDAGIAAIARIPRLEWLSLASRRAGGLTEDGLRRLGDAPRLRTLELEQLPLDFDRIVPALAKLTTLTELDLSDTGVSSAGLALLAGHPALAELDLGRCANIDDAALRTAATLPNLRELRLDRCEQLTAAGLAALEGHESLAKLVLRGVAFGPHGEYVLPMLPAVTELDLSFTRVDDHTLDSLVRLTSLRLLELAGNDQITDDGMRTLSKLVWLESLDLNVCDGFGEDGAAIVRFMLPDAEIVWPDRFRGRLR